MSLVVSGFQAIGFWADIGSIKSTRRQRTLGRHLVCFREGVADILKVEKRSRTGREGGRERR